ncbi:MAG: glycosyltransferase [Bacteroidota bacterium]|nr:glycosyltransferase [Bacteroidota bacterium]
MISVIIPTYNEEAGIRETIQWIREYDERNLIKEIIITDGGSTDNTKVETQFHHSNWKLPYKFENRLNQLIVTPRMHGIHHSNVKQKTDSNYPVIFSAWDRIHNTLDLNKPQKGIVMGVPSYSNPAELTSGFLLKLPFTHIRPWKE